MAKRMMELEEPVTGISFPAEVTFEGLAMLNLGCGARIRKIGIVGVKMYALGVFVENTDQARDSLRPFVCTNPSTDLSKAIMAMDPDIFFSRAAHLVSAAPPYLCALTRGLNPETHADAHFHLEK
jgi:hypothetical protein